MDSYDGRKLNGLKNLSSGRTRLDRIADMPTYAWSVQMCRRRVDRDHDQFLRLRREGAVPMRDAAECKKRF